MYGYIYKTTNLVNNKIYVGQKKANKFLGNRYLGSGRYFKEAVKYYGRENFKVELICECNSPEELDEKEIYYIQYFKAKDKTIGYNLSDGGGGTKGYKYTKEQKKHLSEIRMGHPVSEETRKKISDAIKARGGTRQPGYHHSDETRAKMSAAIKAANTPEVREKHRQAQLGENNSMYGKPAVNRRKCKCITTGEIFNSLQEAADYFGIKSYVCVCNCCRKNEKLREDEEPHKTKGLIFEYYNE